MGAALTLERTLGGNLIDSREIAKEAKDKLEYLVRKSNDKKQDIEKKGKVLADYLKNKAISFGGYLKTIGKAAKRIFYDTGLMYDGIKYVGLTVAGLTSVHYLVVASLGLAVAETSLEYGKALWKNRKDLDANTTDWEGFEGIVGKTIYYSVLGKVGAAAGVEWAAGMGVGLKSAFYLAKGIFQGSRGNLDKNSLIYDTIQAVKKAMEVAKKCPHAKA